ncbi:hypothetical protein EV361DRAFT_11534 [Lentinula raphanica]|nr:hypothetical protein EV361DRAFT_11534 [Lentinula raphanica]
MDGYIIGPFRCYPATSNMSNTATVTPETYPELYLDESEIARLNNSDSETKESLLTRWKVCHSSIVMFEVQYLTTSCKKSKPFLHYFPTVEMIPDRLINAPGNYVRVKLHYGWFTTWDTIVDYIARNYPENLRRQTAEATSPIAAVWTSALFSPQLSEIFQLPTLKVQHAWLTSNKGCAFLAICKNDIEQYSQREQILASEGARKLKETFKLNDPPKWVVDVGNSSWPRNLEGSSRSC